MKEKLKTYIEDLSGVVKTAKETLFDLTQTDEIALRARAVIGMLGPIIKDLETILEEESDEV